MEIHGAITWSIHVPSTTPQMKLPFFVFKFAVSFVSAIADRDETRLFGNRIEKMA
jgi:hypothetical protein